MRQFVGVIMFLLVLSLILIGCTETSTSESNPYSGTCPQGKTESCTGECGNFVDLNQDELCDRSQ